MCRFHSGLRLTKSACLPSSPVVPPLDPISRSRVDAAGLSSRLRLVMLCSSAAAGRRLYLVVPAAARGGEGPCRGRGFELGGGGSCGRGRSGVPRQTHRATPRQLPPWAVPALGSTAPCSCALQHYRLASSHCRGGAGGSDS
jgi:hypothetical protein